MKTVDKPIPTKHPKPTTDGIFSRPGLVIACDEPVYDEIGHKILDECGRVVHDD